MKIALEESLAHAPQSNGEIEGAGRLIQGQTLIFRGHMETNYWMELPRDSAAVVQWLANYFADTHHQPSPIGRWR